MESKKELAAPCGLYCGVCGVYVAHKDNNLKLKERLTTVFNVGIDGLKCKGCLSNELFEHCKTCQIKSCTIEKGIEGCHQCDDFPCPFIDNIRMDIARKVVLRSVPARRKLGTNQWMEEEDKRYHCPHCGYTLFRGAQRCRQCRQPVDVD